ncbi:MAG: ABC transporter ATP-binding protein [Mangrovibacterium sp.]
MDNIIECRNITHHYGSRLIYENLNFEVKQGKVLGLLGKNGTGKTTIINILNGYLQPTSGECRIFGQRMEELSPTSKSNIGLLLEGHIQHNYFTVEQIEKYYSGFFKRWKKEAYYELLQKLQVVPSQKLSTMSCGQRSQVALGLLFAQDPELLIMDDFSMGLDPGYRRLFVQYLNEFALAENKTIFLTSHIIQDMELLIDDCMIMDYGRLLLHKPTKEILNSFKKYTFYADKELVDNGERFWNTERIGKTWETYSFASEEEVKAEFQKQGLEYVGSQSLSLEDAFIGLTGKY